MKTYKTLEQFDAAAGSAVAIGNFDGVHRGHQHIISGMQKIAGEKGITSVVLTFDPHPIEFHNKDINFQYITSAAQKERILSELGVEATVVLDYNHALCSMGPEEFVAEVLVQGLNAKVVVVGPDFTFGKLRSGNVETLKKLGKQYGFEVEIPEDLENRDSNGTLRRLSSTWVREALGNEEVKNVSNLLGRNHAVEGEVVHGAARGRELGFPTANLSCNVEGLVPPDGVYAGWLIVDGQKHPAAISVGSNPTFKGEEQQQVEAHVINRPDEKIEDFDLYGKHVRVEFVKHLRGMVAYTGVRALVEQMKEDIAEAGRILHEER